MKVLQVNFNYNKNTQFCGNKCYSTKSWIALKDVLTRKSNETDLRFGTYGNEVVKLNRIPAFNKAHFEYNDYKNLSPREKLIISILNKIGSDIEDCQGFCPTLRKDLSTKKDAERILDIAQKTKAFLDNKYKNGYKLVGVGNSPAAIVETMQLLGADAVTLPFCQETVVNSVKPLKAEDWKNYFKFYSIDKEACQDTGKEIIFTDYVCEGYTKRCLESILESIGFNDCEFIDILYLLCDADVIKSLNYCISTCLDHRAFKHYAKMDSPRFHQDADVYLHPEYIPSLPEKVSHKLFRCALYDLFEKQSIKPSM